MTRPEVQRLDQLDITQLTLSDVQALKNDVLRRALLDAMTELASTPTHHSHATHSNHYQSVATPVVRSESPKAT